MQVELTYKNNPRGIIITFTGSVTGKELFDFNAKLMLGEPCTYEVWDYSHVDELFVTPDELHEIAIQDSNIPEVSPLSKRALVGSHNVFRGLDEAYHIYSNQWVGRKCKFISRSFDNLEDAMAWVLD